ncbi:hypothetical protein D3C81_1654000 [compost metagenome]
MSLNPSSFFTYSVGYQVGFGFFLGSPRLAFVQVRSSTTAICRLSPIFRPSAFAFMIGMASIDATSLTTSPS